MSKKTYVKSDIVKTLQGNFQKIPNTDVERIVESVFKYLGNALSDGKNIEIRGLGTFKIKNMHERNARNPKTGERKQSFCGSKTFLNSAMHCTNSE